MVRKFASMICVLCLCQIGLAQEETVQKKGAKKAAAKKTVKKKPGPTVHKLVISPTMKQLPRFKAGDVLEVTGIKRPDGRTGEQEAILRWACISTDRHRNDTGSRVDNLIYASELPVRIQVPMQASVLSDGSVRVGGQTWRFNYMVKRENNWTPALKRDLPVRVMVPKGYLAPKRYMVAGTKVQGVHDLASGELFMVVAPRGTAAHDSQWVQAGNGYLQVDVKGRSPVITSIFRTGEVFFDKGGDDTRFASVFMTAPAETLTGNDDK